MLVIQISRTPIIGYVLLDQLLCFVNNSKFLRLIETSNINYNKTAIAQNPKLISRSEGGENVKIFMTVLE